MKVLTSEDRTRIWDIKRRRFFDCKGCGAFFEAERGEFSYGTQREPECSCKCPVCGHWAYEF